MLLAVLAAYFLIQGLFWVMHLVFATMWFLTKIIIVGIVAAPLYIIIRKKLLRG